MQSFGDSVAKEGALWRLLSILERPESSEDGVSSIELEKSTRRKVQGWSVLAALSSAPSIASKLVSSSGWLELVGVLAGYSAFTKSWTARTGAAKTLSRLLWDPVTGSLVCKCIYTVIPS